MFLWLEVPSMWAGYGGPNGLIHMPLCLDKERRIILEKGWRSEDLWTWAGWTRRQTLNSNANFLWSPPTPYSSPFPLLLPPPLFLFSPPHTLLLSRPLLPPAIVNRREGRQGSRLQASICPLFSECSLAVGLGSWQCCRVN